MTNLRNFFRIILSCLIFSGLSVSGANAATLNVVDGLLVGASDVLVTGAGFYNVNFIDGTCSGLFDECDSNADFDFGDPVDANLAAQALVDQVFIDGPDGDFNTNPGQISGCADASRCGVLIPHTALVEPLFLSAITINEGNAEWTIFPIFNNLEFSNFDVKVFAQFEHVSAVPLPAAFWLFGTAVIGLFGFRMRNKVPFAT